jgi:type IX secretion system PorP/SprF family membrane protein
MKFMKRYIILLLLSGAVAINVNAQQLMTASLYDMHGNLHDPATAGAEKHLMIGASYRSMWDGIPGSPKTVLVFGSGYLPKVKLGLGGYIYSDETGPTKRTGLEMAYAYHIPMKNGATFSLGLEARLQQFSLDKAKLQASLGNDPVLAGAEKRFKADAGFGISYNGKKLRAGASVSQLIQSKLDFYSGNLNRTEEAKLYRHYYFHANYTWDVDGNKAYSEYLIYLSAQCPDRIPGRGKSGAQGNFLVGRCLKSQAKLDAFCRCKDPEEIYDRLLL